MRVLMLPAAAAILLIGADLLCAPAVNAQVQSPSPGATDQPSNILDQKLSSQPGPRHPVPGCHVQRTGPLPAALPPTG